LEENNNITSSSQSQSQSQSYQIGVPIGLSHTFQYEDITGYYNAGYTVYFEDAAAASCSKKTFRKLWVLKMERTSTNRRCEWIDVDDETTQEVTTTTTPANNDVEATTTTTMPTDNNAVETSSQEEVTASTNNEVETINVNINNNDSNFPTTTGSTAASCNIHYTPSCSVSNVAATSTVYFLVQPTHSNQNFETYNATVIFNWDSQNITTGSRQYRIGDPIGVSNTHSYDTNAEGKYYVGYTLVFENDDAAAGCSGKSCDAFYLLEMMPRSRCVWKEWETSVSSVPTTTTATTALHLVSGSPTGPAPATTAAELVNASMPSGIPLANNMSSTNNYGDGNNEGANTTTTTTTTSEPTVSLSPTDIPPANKKELDSNGATSGETTMGFILLYNCIPLWSIVVFGFCC